jgi:hypothetical protein
MKLPRRLYRKPDGTYCEESEIETGQLVGPAGMEVSDPEAERLGIVAYYATHPELVVEPTATEEKAEEQASYEDKAEESPAPGLHIPPEQRRRR